MRNNGKESKNDIATMPTEAAAITENIPPEGIIDSTPPPPGGLTREKLEGMMTVSQMPSIVRELLHSGDDVEQLWMRTQITNNKNKAAEKKLDAALNYYDLCVEFDDKAGQAYVRRKLSGWASIDGAAREQAVAAVIGERFKTPKPGQNGANPPPQVKL
ncbi:MAG: hypothetical protein QQM50_02100 [Dehalococcoides mccartyi]|uniref:Uncharacterized protein n=1 Tax=Dehalococcoides mccartyi TaxID=61435 RepID=A0AB38Z7Y4_9CHLR|nr:hypothetical protein [Dehalococcoides mccartyi]APH12598.1 hypothetical protein ASJ33_05240 [Dehalococcoides mccartyi]MDN4185467.1 hypothetical protein [Dehalococcoides mccartyi]MDP4279327.1 hypothetical protein [Dehalococcoides mccartyi]POZ59911.1 hypothetical protein C1O63_0026 [Dehalococcoides mccartyi]WRO06665.1 hypothetical protein VLL09_04550 [Dehalococcoides mccartyi]